ncbi:MAG: hypothetical protein ABJA84_00035 [Polaromonas sp.]
MANPYTRLLGLLPSRPLQVGTVLSTADGTATLQLPGGGIATARGDATVGQSVFFRDGNIEGNAPSLAVEIIEI